MVWIYLIEGNSQFGTSVQALLNGIRTGGHTLLTSNFLLGEILVEPVRKNDAFTVASYRRMLVETSAVEVVPFTAETAVQFAAIRAAHRTSSPDSLHSCTGSERDYGCVRHWGCAVDQIVGFGDWADC
jgi:predicted nucleic acid-binding protein